MADQLLDLRRVPGLALPRDPDNPDDPAVYVLPKDHADEWVAQVTSMLLLPAALGSNLSQQHAPLKHPHAIVRSCSQLFRSMDSESAVGYPADNATAYKLGLQTSALAQS